MTCKDCKHCHTLKTLENKEWKYSYVCTLWLDLKEKGAYLLSVSENDTCECFDRKDVFLKTCPFCGNPAEIVDGEPFSFMPKTPTKKIRCCSEWCFCHSINLRYMPDIKESEMGARNEWNIRRRKNKNTFNDEYVKEHMELEQLKEHKND